MYTLNPPARRRPRHAAVFIAGLLVLTAVLAVRSGWFGFFIVVAFGYSRELLRWPWPLVVGAAAAVIGAISQTGGDHSSLPVHLRSSSSPSVIDLRALPYLHVAAARPGAAGRAAPEVAHRARRGKPAAGGDDRGERGPAPAAARPGAGGRHARRAAADGAGDPRHARPGAHRDRTQLQAAEQAAARTPDEPAGWRRHVDAATQAGAGQPRRGPPVSGRAAARAARGLPAERGAGGRGRALVGPERDPGAGHHHRHGAAESTRRPNSRCSARRRRHWPTWPGTRARAGSG